MNISLIGMAGAGKSYVGEALAQRLGFAFLDIDRVLEEKYGKPLEKIIEELGDERFVQAEGVCLIGAAEGRDKLLISPGGSIIYNAEAMEYLKRNSKIVYLEVPFPVIEKRLDGALGKIVGFKNKTLRQLYDERKSLYETYAHFSVNGNKTPEEIVSTIVKNIRAA